MAVLAACTALLAAPASALAATPTIAYSFAPGANAGSSPAVTFDINFNQGQGDTVKDLTLQFPPGVLFNLSAVRSCLTTPDLTVGGPCEIGTQGINNSTGMGTALFIGPPPAGYGAVAGITSPQLAHLNIAPGLLTVRPGGAGINLSFTQLPATPRLDEQSLLLFATIGGTPFTRLPTSCVPNTSVLSVDYQPLASGPSPAATPSTPPVTNLPVSGFTPTNCDMLRYAPGLTASVIRDRTGKTAEVKTAFTQSSGESASRSISLELPSSITLKPPAAASCMLASCTIGTAVASSPLVPTSLMGPGTVTLSGPVASFPGTQATLRVSFPAIGLSLLGGVSAASNSITFANIPDFPLKRLALDITGPSAGKVFETSCAPSDISAKFSPNSRAAPVLATASIELTGCPAVTSQLTGAAAGKPVLRIKATPGGGHAARFRGFAVLPSGGLEFSHEVALPRYSCVRRHRKCLTTVKAAGLSVSASGSAIDSIALRRGTLVIKFTRPASRVAIVASGPLLLESAALRRMATAHHVTGLKTRIDVRDTANRFTAFTQAVRVSG